MNKRKWLDVLCAIAAAMFILLFIVKCEGPAGPQGPAGAAYTDFWDDFESNTLTRWTQGGDAPWAIANDRVRFGTKSAANTDIGDSQTSSISLALNLDRPGICTFYCSISCEQGFDWLSWYLDDVLVDGLSGQMAAGNWFTHTFAIPSGAHTVKFAYEKDASVSQGLDQGWLDGILITNYALAKTGPVENPVLPEGVILRSQGIVPEKK